MSYDGDTSCHHLHGGRGAGGRYLVYVAHRLLWIRTRRFDGRIGDGHRQRMYRVPDAGIVPSAWADGEGPCGSWPGVLRLTEWHSSGETQSGISAAGFHIQVRDGRCPGDAGGMCRTRS